MSVSTNTFQCTAMSFSFPCSTSKTSQRWHKVRKETSANTNFCEVSVGCYEQYGAFLKHLLFDCQCDSTSGGLKLSKRVYIRKEEETGRGSIQTRKLKLKDDIVKINPKTSLEKSRLSDEHEQCHQS